MPIEIRSVGGVADTGLRTHNTVIRQVAVARQATAWSKSLAKNMSLARSHILMNNAHRTKSSEESAKATFQFAKHLCESKIHDKIKWQSSIA